METLKRFKLRNDILNLIQGSELDIGSAYYIIKDIYKGLEVQFFQQVNLELKELEKKLENESSCNSNS